MKNYSEEEIAKLQRNLGFIRNAGGWTMEEFGEMIGVTKQTISNLEKDFKDKPTMSKTQYIAIRSVLDYEMQEQPDNDLLKSAINLSLNTDKINKENGKKVKAFVSGAKKTGLDDEAIIAGVAALVGVAAAAIVAPGVINAASSWISDILSGDKK